MKTIYIQNGYSKIEGLSEEEKDLLYKTLSYKDKKILMLQRKDPSFLKWSPYKHCFNRKTSKFPTGLLNNVKELLTDYKIVDTRTIPEKYLYLIMNPELPKLRYYQQELIDLPLQSPCAFELATGTGKTLTFAHLIKNIGVNTLIITPNLALKDQITQYLEYCFTKKYVGNLPHIKPITITNIQSLPDLPQEFFDYYDMIICDESHHSSANTYQDLNKKQWANIYYRYYFTGTYYRNDGTDMILWGVGGPVVYSYTIQQAIADKYLVPPSFYIMRLGKEERFYGGVNPDFHKVYQEKIVENDKRNAIIIKLANEMKDKACLIIVERIEHGKTLSSMIPGSVFVNGEDMTSNENKKEIENFNLNKINRLVSTSGICGEGIDIPRAELLIMAGAFKAKSQVVQKIGRILRLSDGKKEAIVFDFDDANLPFLEAHSKQRIKIYKTYNTEIKFFDV